MRKLKRFGEGALFAGATAGAGLLAVGAWVAMVIIGLLIKAGVLVALIWLVWKGLQMVGIL